MKIYKTSLALLLLCLAISLIACKKKNAVLAENNHSNAPILIELKKDYPKLTLSWQDIATVEYIPLETTEDILIEDYNSIFLTEKTIIVCNKSEGGIFTFDRKGKLLSRFNNKGGSGQEYISIYSVAYDEEGQEISIFDILKRQIFTYSQEGKFIRSIPVRKKGYLKTLNSFDKNLYLVCFTNYSRNGEVETNSYKFISKMDGSIIDSIPLSFSKIVPESFKKMEGNNLLTVLLYFTTPIIRENDRFILADISSDTIYSITSDRKMKPIFVRTPSLSETSFPLVLNAYLKTDSYFFFGKIDYDYQASSLKGIQEKLNKVEGESYVLDLKTNKLYIEDIHNADFPDSDISAQRFSFNEMNRNQYVCEYQSYKLKKALEEGKLSGKLKEIATNLKDDDNPVLMVIKFK